MALRVTPKSEPPVGAVLGATPPKVVRALALSGGGSKIAFEAGVAEALLKGGRSYQVIGGTSCGSLAAALLAQGSTAQSQLAQAVRLSRIILDIKGEKDIYDGGSWFTRALRALGTGALNRPSGLQRLLDEHVNEHVLAASATRFRAGVVDMISGTHLVIGNHADPWVDLPATRQTILASSSMPCFFPVVRHGAYDLVDGGVRDMTPLRAIIQAMELMPADFYDLDVVLCSPLDPFALREESKPKDPLWLAGRALGLLENEVFRGDLREALWRNSEPDYALINVRVFAPEGKFFRELRQGTLEFNPEKLRSLLRHGQERSLSPYTGAALQTVLM